MHVEAAAQLIAASTASNGSSSASPAGAGGTAPIVTNPIKRRGPRSTPKAGVATPAANLAQKRTFPASPEAGRSPSRPKKVKTFHDRWPVNLPTSASLPAAAAKVEYEQTTGVKLEPEPDSEFEADDVIPATATKVKYEKKKRVKLEPQLDFEI